VRLDDPLGIASAVQASTKALTTQDTTRRDLVTDYTKLDVVPTKFAATAKVSLPAAPNAEQRAMHAKLVKGSKANFNAMFVSGQFWGTPRQCSCATRKLSARHSTGRLHSLSAGQSGATWAASGRPKQTFRSPDACQMTQPRFGHLAELPDQMRRHETARAVRDSVPCRMAGVMGLPATQSNV
jgi:hypothetical protein